MIFGDTRPPAIDLARAACALSNSAQAVKALELAWEAGASADQTAALAASFGCADLLARSLARGADPEGRAPLLHDRERAAALWRLDDGARPSLLARALLAGSASCCSVLCDAGANLLADASCAELLARLPNDGVARWPAIASSLAGLAPNPAGAQLLAEALVPSASRQFDSASTNMATGAGEALAALERLCELGARLDEGVPSLAQSLFELACSGIARADGDGDGGPQKAMNLLCALCERRDPASSAERVASCLRAFCKSPGGHASILPEPSGALALRWALSLSAMACSGRSPAALAILRAASEGLGHYALYGDSAVDLQRAMDTPAARAGRKSLSWLAGEAPSWTPAEPAALEECSRALLDALCASARLFGQRAEEGSAAPAAWARWAESGFAAALPARQAAALPLMAAQLARASDPRLASIFERVAPAAAALAQPGLPSEQIAALLEAAEIARAAVGAAPGPSALRL